MQVIGNRTEPTAAILGLVGIVRALGWLPEAVTDAQLLAIVSGLGALVVYFGAQRVKRNGNGGATRQMEMGGQAQYAGPSFTDIRVMVQDAVRQDREEREVEPSVAPPEPERPDPSETTP